MESQEARTSDATVAEAKSKLEARLSSLRRQRFALRSEIEGMGNVTAERAVVLTKKNLEDVLCTDEQDLLLPVRRLSDDGLKAWQEVKEKGYEGFVAKDPASPYVGGRTSKWLKVKQAEGERGWEPKR